MTTYLLAGGGTAGHVNPLLAVAERIRVREPDAEVLVLGTAEGLEARLVPERGFELLTIDKLPFPRRPNRAALNFPRRLRETIVQVAELIVERGVDVVVGFGGYVAAPAYLGARKAGVPLVIHEANSRPGMANRLGSLFTSFVGTAFDRTRIRGGVVVGMPLRAEIETLDRFAARAEADDFFGLDPHKPTLLVTGGSSGAKRINDTVAGSVARILGAGWQVLHITGEYRDGVDDPGLRGYVVIKYCNRMELALASADLAIARAGTSTVAELTGLGVPAIYVPYPVGNGEQKYNARTATDAGAAIVVADAHFTGQWISAELVPLLRRRAEIADMAARASTIGSLDGTDRMLELVDRALGRDLPLTS
ncbi:UDP-N-acetylglucosamine--N-acetylmuramyl- (pentapeptide) pyrophosphoryl-undecaprenol N-acetylglucosamine transferase [Leifsonia rubra CMS 76R]|nr:UDP-N-acetylglucosamine--N-acetylmuramyl- (pentapeptide) pyrophosphoryl-undecaprenol N-acetylglucosamine transferase [Leifsonia rubra CMS 76R]